MKDYSEIYAKYDKYLSYIEYKDQYEIEHVLIDFNYDLAKEELDSTDFLIALVYCYIKRGMTLSEGSEMIDMAKSVVLKLQEFNIVK